MRTLKLFAIACLTCKAILIQAQTSASMDNSIITKPAGSGYAMTVQPDGKILAGGSSPGNVFTNLTVVRYNANGSIDQDFGINGRAIAKFGGNSAAYSIVLQPDGRILAAGTAHDDFAVARFKADGLVDSSFGTNGKVSFDFEGGRDQFNFITRQPDNKILAVGTAFVGELTTMVLVRLNPDGSYDKSFGKAGIVSLDLNDYKMDLGSSVILKEHGKILVAGYTYNPGTDYDFTLVRLKSNGTIDSSFGSDGHVYTDVTGGFDIVQSAAVQSDGKIILGGYYDFFASKFILARYNKNGRPDSSFGTNGKVITSVRGTDDKAYGMAIQSDDKIVLSGYAYNGSNTDLAIVRYNKNGGRDNTFGTLGKVTTDINDNNDTAHAVSILQDGKILIAGSSAGKFVLAWYNENGSQLINTGSAGIASLTTNKGGPSVSDIKIYPNPVKDILGINGLNASYSTSLSAVDASGRTLKQTTVQSANYNWNIKQLHPGIYYLMIDVNMPGGYKKSFSVKFMKE